MPWITYTDRIQEIVESILSKAWKQGMISREDEPPHGRMVLLINPGGFARTYVKILEQSHSAAEARGALFREIWQYGLGMGHYHARFQGKTAKQRWPVEYALAKKIADAIVKEELKYMGGA